VRAGDRILEFLGTSSLEAYAADELLSSAVERQFEIVGEALARAVRSEPGLADAIPQSRRVIGFRNVLAPGYDVVDDETVFDNAMTELPIVLETLRALLDSDDMS
jgi:uncharacterized protein with HEPN domain